METFRVGEDPTPWLDLKILTTYILKRVVRHADLEVVFRSILLQQPACGHEGRLEEIRVDHYLLPGNSSPLHHLETPFPAFQPPKGPLRRAGCKFRLI
jgi:hypothetical protein